MKLIAAAALAVSLAVPAWSQSQCAQINEVHDILTGMYGEEMIAEGYDQRGSLVQWWGNSNSGSWTVIVVSGAIGCIAAQGEKFRRVILQPNV